MVLYIGIFDLMTLFLNSIDFFIFFCILFAFCYKNDYNLTVPSNGYILKALV